LVVAASRLAYLGKAPEQLQRKAQQVAYVDAAAILGSRAGRTLGQVLEAIQQAYAEIGVPDAWQHHHQGGLIAYQSREKLALPHSPLELVAGQACAWNPSLPGAKSEDTILITPNGYEIITPLPTDFPTVSITLGGQTIVRPGIVEL
jgi:antitoxin VapB